MTEATTDMRVEFRVSPDRYRHWKLSTDGPVATLTMDVDEQGGLVPGYELKLNSYDLGVDIELYDAVQRLRFEHPEVRAVVITSGKPKVFCAGANIRMLAGVAARLEGELLQVHQRDPERHRGRHRPLRPGLPGRGERHRVRRRVRAGAGVRAHHAGRRPVLGGVAARAAAARRAAGHRRADPGVRQAARAAGPGRLLLHQVRGRRREEGRAVAPGRRGGAAAAVDEAVAERAAELASRSGRPQGATGVRADPARPRPATTTRSATTTSRPGSTATRAGSTYR